MEQFTYNMPTKVYFGKGSIDQLKQAIKPYGKRALLVYGGGSIKKIGLYAKICSVLKEEGVFFEEVSGVAPNPKIHSVRECVALCKAHSLEVIIAAGGGSTIDCAKAAAACYYYDGDAWDGIRNPKEITQALPVIAIPTISATGSETDDVAVISNPEIPLKAPMHHSKTYPKVAIIDPEYTYSVSAFQTASGTADIFSHVLEVYFNRAETDFLTDRLCEAVLKTCIRYGKQAMIEPHDYEARSNLAWAASLALNGLLRCGKRAHSFGCHALEHVLSAYFDVTHGAGLAVIIPRWMEAVLSEETLDKFYEYGTNVFELPKAEDRMQVAKKAIQCTKDWLFEELGLPSTLQELGVTEDRFFDMASDAAKAGLKNAYVPLSAADAVKIYEACTKA